MAARGEKKPENKEVMTGKQAMMPMMMGPGAMTGTAEIPVPKMVAVSDGSEGSLGGSTLTHAPGANPGPATVPIVTPAPVPAAAPKNPPAPAVNPPAPAPATATGLPLATGANPVPNADDTQEVTSMKAEDEDDDDSAGFEILDIDDQDIFDLGDLQDEINQMGDDLGKFRHRAGESNNSGDDHETLVDELLQEIENLQGDLMEWKQKGERQHHKHKWHKFILMHLLELLHGLLSHEQMLFLLHATLGPLQKSMCVEGKEWQMHPDVRACLREVFGKFGIGYTSVWKHIAYVLGNEEFTSDPGNWIMSRARRGGNGLLNLSRREFESALLSHLIAMYPDAPFDVSLSLSSSAGMHSTFFFNFMNHYRRRVRRRLNVAPANPLVARMPSAAELAQREEEEKEEEEREQEEKASKGKSDKS